MSLIIRLATMTQSELEMQDPEVLAQEMGLSVSEARSRIEQEKDKRKREVRLLDQGAKLLERIESQMDALTGVDVSRTKAPGKP